MSCQFLILKLLRPLIDIVRALPNPPVAALQEFMKAAEELLPCFEAQTPAGVLPFVRDLLCLEIRSLTCLRRNLESMEKLAAAQPSAVTGSEVQAVIDSYQPMVGLLDAASGLFQIVGLNLKAPPLMVGDDPSALAADQEIVGGFIDSLRTIVDGLGGCSYLRTYCGIVRQLRAPHRERNRHDPTANIGSRSVRQGIRVRPMRTFANLRS